MYCECQMKLTRHVYISKAYQIKRMNCAKKYKNEPIALWKNILFTDEIKFEIFGVKKPSKIWRSVNEEFKDKCVAKTIKYGGGSVMVGCRLFGLDL